jgi:DNA-binding XRE family transcriptional regulator
MECPGKLRILIILENMVAQNNVKKVREKILMSKSELAKKAKISPLTIDRVEKGYPCRVETKRKIIKALGYKLSERTEVFPEG